MTQRVAYSYVRFSTPDQIKGDSLRRQLELSQRYAEEHGLEIDTSLKLRDLGLSAYDGSNLERGALGVFLDAVRRGKVKPGSFLLVESLDRLSRTGVIEALPVFLEMIKAGVTIVTLADGMAYSQQSVQDNWTQLIMSLAVMARAHEESATKSKRISAVWAEKKRNASQKVVTSQVPAWLSVVDGKIVVDEAKAEIIREIFRLIRGGFGLNLIERKLNSEKIPIVGDRAERWHRSYLVKLSRNRALIGEYQPMKGRVGSRQPSGDVVKNYYPTILTEAEFFAAQKALDDRQGKGGRKGKGIANIFSGLCRCGYCGGPMRYINKNSATKEQYLVCTNAKVGVGCRYVLWRYDAIERGVLLGLRKLDVPAILKDGSAQQAKDALEAKKAKLSAVKKGVRNLVFLAEQAEDVAVLQQRLGELRAEERSLTTAVEELEKLAAVPALSKGYFAQFRKLQDAMEKAKDNELIELRLRINQDMKRFVERIEFYPDGAEPWFDEMRIAGIRPGRDRRFWAIIFKSGEGRVRVADSDSLGFAWPTQKMKAELGEQASWPTFPLARIGAERVSQEDVRVERIVGGDKD